MYKHRNVSGFRKTMRAIGGAAALIGALSEGCALTPKQLAGELFYDSGLSRTVLSDPYAGMPIDSLVASISGPEEAQRYVNRHLFYDYNYNGPSGAPLEYLHAARGATCGQGSDAVAALLAGDGYEPLFMTLSVRDGIENIAAKFGDGVLGKLASKMMPVPHGVYVFEQNGRYGSAGVNYADFFPAKFESLDDLFSALNKRFGYVFGSYSMNSADASSLVHGIDSYNDPETGFLVREVRDAPLRRHLTYSK